MGIPRFFKLKEPNRFNYSPLYWDPEKEAREERVRRIKAELGQEVSFSKRSSAITRGSFRQHRPANNRKAGRESNIRLVIIAAVLFLLAYILFYR
jgi:Flp pilus assembly protein TadB